MSKNVLYSFCVKIHPKENKNMAEKKDSRHRTLTEARKAANKRYIDKFVEVKVDETMERDKEAKKK